MENNENKAGSNAANPKLAAGEVAHIWDSYMVESASIVVLKYFNRIVKSDDIRSLTSQTLQSLQKDIEQITKIMKDENYPLPNGFSEKDLNNEIGNLFTDEFILFYLNNMAKTDFALTSVSLTDAVRADVRGFYEGRMKNAMELNDKAVSLLLEKGLFVRCPYIYIPKEAEEVQKLAEPGFLDGLFTKQRPLLAREVSELHKNVMTNWHGSALLMGFHQVSKSEDVRDLLLRGKEIANKHMKIFSDILIENDLPVGMTWDTHVLNSQESPFSDKLIMFLLTELNKLGIMNYGLSLAVSAREDLQTTYARLIIEVQRYAEDIKQLRIKKEWMEKPPTSLDRHELAKV
jgi:hypothetical protein